MFKSLHKDGGAKIDIDVDPSDQLIPKTKGPNGQIRKATLCKHKDRRLFCKGMCNYCYNRYGRPGNKRKCINHSDRSNYCKQRCKACYMKLQRQIRRQRQGDASTHSDEQTNQ